MTTTFFTFVGDQCGKAKEALDLYTRIFPNSEIKKIIHYAEGEAGGTPALIKYGEFSLNDVNYMVSESNYNHAWSFSPAVSILIKDDSEKLIQSLYEALSADGGMVLMPLDDYQNEGDYGFGKQFGWVQDRYGVNWQFLLTD